MNRETYDALVASVEKWRKNATVPVTKARIGTIDCPLCGLFRWQTDECCGCPVRNAVRRRLCERSPYAAAAKVATAIFPKNKAWKRAAQREADFLAALVPAGGPDE